MQDEVESSSTDPKDNEPINPPNQCAYSDNESTVLLPCNPSNDRNGRSIEVPFPLGSGAGDNPSPAPTAAGPAGPPAKDARPAGLPAEGTPTPGLVSERAQTNTPSGEENNIITMGISTTRTSRTPYYSSDVSRTRELWAGV